MIVENFFDQLINNINTTCENIRKLAIGKGDDYTTGCSLDYPYFKDYYKIIAIDLSKQEALDADPRKIFFIVEQEKETILKFSQVTVKIL